MFKVFKLYFEQSEYITRICYEALIKSLHLINEEECFTFLDNPNEYNEKPSASWVQLIRYIPPGNNMVPLVERHTDTNLITLVPYSGDAALEVVNEEGEWFPLESHCCEKEEVMVVFGDKIEPLTGSRLLAIHHRVVALPGIERFSIPFKLSCEKSWLY